MRVSSALLAAVLALASLVAACGDDDSGPQDRMEATLVLDFVPGPVHAGIYLALERGLYEREGIDLEVIEPTSTADTLKLIDAGQADFGIADGIDVANQIADGRDAQGIMALTQRPLGGLITLERSGYASPRELEGATVGITGVPSDDAVLDAIVAGAGGDPGAVETVTIGFNGVQNLENEKVDAFTGYIPADGVQVEADGFETRSFALDEFGGPSYPGLVVFSTREQIGQDAELMQAFVSATVAGYAEMLGDPEAGVDALVAANPAIPREFADASLDAYEPFFGGDAERYGAFDAARLRDLSDFMLDYDLAAEPIQPERFATNRFVDAAR